MTILFDNRRSVLRLILTVSVIASLTACRGGSGAVPGEDANGDQLRGNDVIAADVANEHSDKCGEPDNHATEQKEADCTDECGPEKSVVCARHGRRVCDDYRGDGCLRLGDVIPCPEGLQCAGGDCVCVPDCGGAECGTGACGQICGQCVDPSTCVSGQCVDCSCKGKACGTPARGCPTECGICPPGMTCDIETLIDAETNVCKECAADCIRDDGTAVECGSDGCSGSCGTCTPGLACNEASGRCEMCVPSCGPFNECGDDGCGGKCGDCGPYGFCDELGDGLSRCNSPCDPDKNCSWRECGSDGCPYDCMYVPAGECGPVGECPVGYVCDPGLGACLACEGVCGTCGPESYCGTDYACHHVSELCTGRSCGSFGGVSCGECVAGLICGEDGSCVPPDSCKDNCAGRQCGPDSCGGQCGVCPADSFCDDYGLCRTCAWACWDRDCGYHPCGWLCGICSVNQTCKDFKCTDI
jgi:hypothetical protein